jgi:hypothetical protein
VDLIEYFMFLLALFLTAVGLIFTASGFGVFVVGRLDGSIIIVIGAMMFGAGWFLSGARGFPSATAAVLNMLDASLTVAFWNFEINPFALALGPTLFMTAKITSSLAITLYAKLHPNPRKGGIVLSVLFAFTVGWNLSQHLGAYLGLQTHAYSIFLGTILSFAASAIVLYVIFLGERIEKKGVPL